MYFKSLRLFSFRNYKEACIEFPKQGAILYGNNGSGKSNLLEAIFLLCTGRSQRNAKKEEMIHFGSLSASVEGELISETEELTMKRSINFTKDAIVSMKINDNKIFSFSEWFGSQAIVSFSTDDINLVYGASFPRRRFLDVLISLLNKEYLQALIEYRKNLLMRNKLLKGPMDVILCEIYEERMAEFGSKLQAIRSHIIEEISIHFSSLFQEICSQSESVSLIYEPSFRYDNCSKKSCKEVFYTMLCERRKKDQILGFSACGPHRDDVQFFINKRPVKNIASQGQCRSLVLSLKMSAIMCLEKVRRDRTVILFDDAVSELDSSRTEKVFSLVEKKGQLFVSSPCREVPATTAIPRYLVSGGAVTVV